MDHGVETRARSTEAPNDDLRAHFITRLTRRGPFAGCRVKRASFFSKPVSRLHLRASSAPESIFRGNVIAAA